MNIAILLRMAAEAMGERPALTGAGISLTYVELDRAARRAAALIRESGSEYVCQLGVSSPAAPVALFGGAIAGTPYVPVNYRITSSEIEALLLRASPALVVADPEFAAGCNVAASRFVATNEFLGCALDAGEAIEDGAEDPDEVAVQLFTSGTTGEPKAAVLSHNNLFSYIVGTVEFASAGEEEATLVTVPPYHIAGISAVLSSVYAGRRIVQLPNFDPATWLDLAAREKVTHAFLVPTMLSRIIQHVERSGLSFELPALRSIAYGGGRMPPETIEKAMALLPHVDFTNAYGLTETSSTICILGPDDHRAAMAAKDAAGRRRLSSVGRPVPSVEIEIRHDGQPVGSGEAGNIFVRAPQVSGRYKGQGSLLDADGWFDTRDRGYIDEEGYVFLDGRSDDVIVRGGENISPGEVEDVLISHPSILDAAVVGIPDSEWGEAVAAAVVASEPWPSEQEIQALVRNRLRSSRVPVKIRVVRELPYNDMGKLLRRVVRDELLAEQGAR